MNKFKSEKGGITVFVIIAFLFILTILISIYMKNTNYQISTLQSEQRLKSIYSNDVNNVNEVYLDMVSTISIGGRRIEIGSAVGSLSANYGDTVDSSFFSSVSGVSWQLFYDDEIYVYLIASDYVENSKLPCVGNTIGNTTYTATNGLIKSTSSTNNWSKYCAYFDESTPANLLLATPYSSGSASITITNNPLSSTYLKWATDSTNGYTSSTNNNIRAVAYMMDRDKWSSFAGNSYEGAFAIGGPTIELFVKSYNSKHDTKLGEYDTISKTGTANVNSNGYLLKIGEGAWQSADLTLDTIESMWVKTSSPKAGGYWLASPYGLAAFRILAVRNNANIGGPMFYANGRTVTPRLGFPPTSLHSKI